jgi:hypothetical protein
LLTGVLSLLSPLVLLFSLSLFPEEILFLGDELCVDAEPLLEVELETEESG